MLERTSGEFKGTAGTATRDAAPTSFVDHLLAIPQEGHCDEEGARLCRATACVPGPLTRPAD